jgi:proteasome accessory factor B
MKSPKLHRWLDLLAALLRHRFPVTFEQLILEVPAYAAEQKDESRRRTFERDKEELRKFGVPIETVDNAEGEPQGYRLRLRDFYLPYLTLRSQGARKPRKLDREGYRSLPTLSFEPEELAAVADAAARVRQLGDPLLSEHVESAMRKLACDLPVDAAGGGAEAGDTRLVPARSAAAADLLVTLGRALESRKRVTFRYHALSSDSTGRREVEPFGLFFLNQHWYLAARTPGEEVVKNFRLNRIEVAEVNTSKPKAPDYEIPESFRLRDHARSRQAWELGAGDAVEATVTFRARTGAASAAFRLGEAVEGLPDRRRFRIRRSDAFARWLLSFGGDLVPVAPREIVDEYHGLIRETLAHHETDRPPAVPPSRR